MLGHHVETQGKYFHLGAWKKDKVDPRDKIVSVAADIKLPDVVDLQPGQGPCFDQGSLGSCTANAIVSMMMDVETLETGKPADPYSRLFVYLQERKIEGTIFEDSGAELRDGLKSLLVTGAPREKDWPYIVSKFMVDPPKKIYDLAAQHQALYYYRCADLQSLKFSLSRGHTAVFGFEVPENMMSDECARTGIVMPPELGEAWSGGHAVKAVGYDMNFKFSPTVIGGVKCKNSWSNDWGMDGYFMLPMSWWAGGQAALATDIWTIRRMEIV